MDKYSHSMTHHDIPRFRVWDTQRQLMSPVWDIGYRHNSTIYLTTDEYTNYKYPSDTLVLMQSTGYTDKNDKLIYEHDILLIGDSEYHVVRWGEFNDCCVWGETWVLYPGFFNAVLTDNAYKTVIVGNIYQNPDLITAKLEDIDE